MIRQFAVHEVIYLKKILVTFQQRKRLVTLRGSVLDLYIYTDQANAALP